MCNEQQLRDESGNDPHVLTNLLKLWLKSLPDPLLVSNMYDLFLSASGNTDNFIDHAQLADLSPDLQR